MSIALILIEDAYHMIGVKNSEVALVQSEIDLAVRHLNRILVRYESRGLHFGQSKVTDENGDTNIPDFAEELIITSLAIVLAPSFGVPVDPAVILNNNEAEAAVRRILIEIPHPRFPSVLPVGSGNLRYNTRRKYFQQHPDELSDSHGSIHDEEGGDIHTETTHSESTY